MFTNLLLTCLILKQRKETIFGLNREKLGTITIMYHMEKLGNYYNTLKR